MSDNFEYKYTALTEEERAEAENIRNQYLIKDGKNEKLDKLRRLDGKVKNIPVCISLIFGVLGTLIFGLGLTMVLEWGIITWGVACGAVGLCLAGLAYFSHEFVKNYLTNKYSEEIIEISNEILNEDKEEKSL